MTREEANIWINQSDWRIRLHKIVIDVVKEYKQSFLDKGIPEEQLSHIIIRE